MQTRVQVFFSGTVQGVGFRYTVKSVSEKFAAAGWVRNLYDGRVEMQAEGTRAELENFIAAIESAMRGYIDSKAITWHAASGKFTAFSIAPTA